ncbi:MAG TPA: hypothetical protein VLJ20_07880 [Acetobacteraceae bacterium]|nr:hypothetical protein [Acetobacteraceae bacterium]
MSVSMRVLGAMLLAASLGIAGAPALHAQAPAAPAASWPHTLSEDGATVEVYQPQAISWPDHGTLNARAAMSITRPGDKTPILGTVDVAFATQTDMATREVTLSDPKLVASHFPSLDTGQAVQLDQRIKAALGGIATKQVPLDAIVLSLRDTVQPAPVALDNEPPEIFHSARPASLVVFDGDPVLAPVGGSGLEYAVNTNWDVFHDPAGGGTWYLLNNGAWFSGPAAKGPYKPVERLPAAFGKIPNDPNFAEVRKSIPARPVKLADAPTIFVSTKPAEIIVTTGPPAFAPVPGTSLQQVKNSNATLFLDTGSGRFYYLVSGRWFASTGLDGPWTFATPDLPPAFAMIPPSSNAGGVLPSVPGTAQAQQALIEAQIPHQATLKRDAAKPAVAYVGEPDFKPIQGTTVAYAVNTTEQILKVDGRYYACFQGAWFVGASPTGPWALAESVPAAIYAIPPSSPVYNVTYVKVYGSTPETVTYGYTAGYAMGFITAGVLAYGTGYYYPPVVVAGRVPAYLPYPYSYAGGVYYNPANGVWARGGAVYGPYGAAKGGAYYNPATGGYARGGAVYGPYGGAGAWSAYNPHTGTYSHGSAAWGPNGGTAHANFANPRYGVAGSTTQNANAYGRWGSSVVSGPNQTVHTASASNARGSAGAVSSSTGAAAAGVHGRGGNNAAVARGSGGNVYAGADGNVYKHTDSGWSKWDNGSWNQAQKPANSAQNRTAAQTRTETQTRTQSGAVGATQSGRRYGEEGGQFGQLDRDRQARDYGSFGQDRFGGGGFRSGGERRFR